MPRLPERAAPGRQSWRCYLLAAALALGGCKLVDQTTFAPPPAPKAAEAPPALRPGERIPLVTIRFDLPDPDYGAALEQAVRAAQARRPNIAFDLVSLLPATDAATVQAGQADVTRVARDMVTLGVPATRLHLGVRPAPDLRAREVHVYVR